ncbi:GCN5-related N-acetyltransferase [Gluconacetobacter diazotrophicus PA1 5]|uniref:GNAT family N-acetyltransferase n=2 Tax=Gluconacetobacter diazotrophicus TaxID=33996 RepID=A0A7W4I414_GLUDI|nr:GNAT family N-acetyltransferase [Gluconacetobacter diazotrophicus]ACI52767.1 GCN5-related N-acetyltransferase [Gluconacetobacter diazotrophicus PA1 5]MBB2155492.1 GNAT family N-acetyltransferase [Gluconacetobacter diazotrophicus]TWB06108.1 acetyltransferase (GNAT) family protein [Gluconacetobacter diazotrophicus]CAP57277.1 putative acetyl transferase protein [Gluconacetobacter diazotrophicus PA1 5]
MVASVGDARADSGPATRAVVDVTFLCMDAPPSGPAPALPEGYRIVHQPAPGVAFYRRLYDGVGKDYCWWLRRVVPDRELAALLRDPGVLVHVLWRGEQVCGFFELDRTQPDEVNLAYFGLMPGQIGHGIGHAFLRAALDAAWAFHPDSVRVNTCTADHPRAMETYLRAGFRPVRTVREVWDIPDRLGLTVPRALRP